MTNYINNDFESLSKKNYILSIYCDIYALAIAQATINQYNKNNTGAYFWLIKNKDNKNIFYYHNDKKMMKMEFSGNDKEINILKEILRKIGYEITETIYNNTLITITKKNIIKLVEILRSNGYEIIKSKDNTTLIPRKK